MTPPEPPAVVLDTNATLDWLVFGDAAMQPLASAIEAGSVRWLACAGMRVELERVLAYPKLARWMPACEHTLQMFDRLHHACAQPPRATGLACSDPDDQVFIDLAVCGRAHWLVTHDRALHRLSRAVRPWGVAILRPAQWRPATAAGTSASIRDTTGACP